MISFPTPTHAEDVGTSVADMEIVARRSSFVAGLPHRGAQAEGDPAPWTALSVFVSLQAALGRPLTGVHVAVQGLGSVGFKLCALLNEHDARLVVADVDEGRAEEVRRRFGAEVVPVERIHRADAEVFSPNALGAVLNVDAIPDLGAPLVCGGANNQLAGDEDSLRPFTRGVTYAPDYVVNAGGIINVGIPRRVRRVGEVAGAGHRRSGLRGPAAGEGGTSAAHEEADRMASERPGRRLAERAV
ncbi:hypothetical protein [Phenylobacterium sp.]|uniref:hypothetical protein n=1 Tax=Phenylobacterium sp. TaxID=1871053 RepID=UPI002FC84E84